MKTGQSLPMPGRLPYIERYSKLGQPVIEMVKQQGGLFLPGVDDFSCSILLF